MGARFFRLAGCKATQTSHPSDRLLEIGAGSTQRWVSAGNLTRRWLLLGRSTPPYTRGHSHSAMVAPGPLDATLHSGLSPVLYAVGEVAGWVERQQAGLGEDFEIVPLAGLRQVGFAALDLRQVERVVDPQQL